MTQLSPHGFQYFWRRNCYSFLAFFWLLGIASGILFYHALGEPFLSLMRGALHSTVSIVGLLSVTVLPFFVSAFVVYISKPLLLLPVCFGKSFLFSLVSFAVIRGFQSAGWLVRLFLCFSDCAMVSVLYLFWLRYISGVRKFSFWEMFLFLSIALLIASLDFTVIAPFLMRLIY